MLLAAPPTNQNTVAFRQNCTDFARHRTRHVAPTTWRSHRDRRLLRVTSLATYVCILIKCRSAVTKERDHVTCRLSQAHPVTSSHELSLSTVIVVSPPVELRTNSRRPASPLSIRSRNSSVVSSYSVNKGRIRFTVARFRFAANPVSDSVKPARIRFQLPNRNDVTSATKYSTI